MFLQFVQVLVTQVGSAINFYPFIVSRISLVHTSPLKIRKYCLSLAIRGHMGKQAAANALFLYVDVPTKHVAFLLVATCYDSCYSSRLVLFDFNKIWQQLNS